MPVPDKFSDFVSGAALLLSALSLYISYRNYHRDVGVLKLTLRFEADPSHGNLYLLTITNIGRRPVTLIKVVARLKNQERCVVYDSNIVLNETASKEIIVPMVGFHNESPLMIRAFDAEDSSGRIYRVRTWKMYRQVRKLASPHS
jgi:hypothetical protein